jgi:hypothetical protein
MVGDGRDGAKPKKPAGWYGKEARAARAAIWAAGEPIRAQRKAIAEREKAMRTNLAAKIEPVRASARKLLASIPADRVRVATADVITAAKEHEAKRVAAIIRRERTYRRSEPKRIEALREVDDGEVRNIADSVSMPTPEQMKSGSFEPYTVEKTDGTVRQVATLRRVSEARIVQLHARGVLTDDTYPAVLWYRRAWEKTGYDTVLSASGMGERSAGGERAYGHMARTAVEAEARFAVHFAAGFIPADMLGTFDRVVLQEMTITDAARAAKCRYTNVTAVVRHAALLLLGGIGHLLPVRAVGAPGSSPVVLSEPEPADLDAAAHEPGAVATADPKFLDERGYMLPWEQISAIIRGGVADEAA